MNTSSKENRTINNLSGNFNYNWIIGKKGTNFSADFDFLNYNRKSAEELESNFLTLQRSRKATQPLNFENLTPSSVKTYAAKADLKLPLTTNESFYFGVKATNVNTTSSRIINLNSNYPNLKIPNTLFNY